MELSFWIPDQVRNDLFFNTFRSSPDIPPSTFPLRHSTFCQITLSAMDIKRWFDRDFAFGLPAWMYPLVLERLRGTPARAEDLVAGLSPDVLTRRIGDRWSIQENIGHLLDLEPLWIGRVEDLREGKAYLREADLSNRKTHEANHHARPMDALLRDFRDVRTAFVQQLDTLDDDLIERTALHPRLEQPMRLLDLLFFVAEHDDHHLAQITRLKRSSEQG